MSRVYLPTENVKAVKELFQVDKSKEIAEVLGQAISWGNNNLSEEDIKYQITRRLNFTESNGCKVNILTSLEEEQKFIENAKKFWCSQSQLANIYLCKFLEHYSKLSDEEKNQSIKHNNNLLKVYRTEQAWQTNNDSQSNLEIENVLLALLSNKDGNSN